MRGSKRASILRAAKRARYERRGSEFLVRTRRMSKSELRTGAESLIAHKNVKIETASRFFLFVRRSAVLSSIPRAENREPGQEVLSRIRAQRRIILSNLRPMDVVFARKIKFSGQSLIADWCQVPLATTIYFSVLKCSCTICQLPSMRFSTVVPRPSYICRSLFTSPSDLNT